MSLPIERALYPDRSAPTELRSLADRIDYLSRVCSAWDFGRLPDLRTIEAIRGSDWRKAVDATRLLTSPAYHLLRRWHGLPELPYLGQQMAHIRDDPNLHHV
jgi:hypothetical protein